MDAKLFFLGIGLAVVIVFCGASIYGSVEKATQHTDRETLYQVSTMNALAQGAFGGVQTIGELKKHGDFGIGTFDGLDGEMIVLEGKVYQVRSDGTVIQVTDSEKTPFSTVTWFDRDYSIKTESPMNYTGFTNYLTTKLPSKNTMYAIRIHGMFPVMKVRSIPEQQQPYPSLVAAAANQSVFTYENAEGTIVGFYLPGFMSGPNMAGYHLHFISDSRQTGGHILDFDAGADTMVELDATPQLFVAIPQSVDSAINTSMDVGADLAKVER